MNRSALVVGSTGITGQNLSTRLLKQGWEVYGLSRRPAAQAGLFSIAADLQDPDSVRRALADIDVSHVFICTWLRQNTEAENVRVNGAMLENLFAALEPAKIADARRAGNRHKQYLGPFESYGQTAAETPFVKTPLACPA